MTFFVRQWEDRDADPAKAIQHSIYPEYATEAEEVSASPHWRAASQFDAPPGSPFRYVAVDEDDGHLAGYAALWRVRTAQFRVDLMVHPNRRSRGAGSSLLLRLISDARSSDAATVQARAREDHGEAIEFLSHRGFIPAQKMFGLELTVAEFRASEWAPVRDRLAERGIRLVTLERARSEDAAWLRKLHALHNAALPDWPDPDPDPAGFAPVAFEKFRRRVDAEVTRPEAFFIAISHDRYVGYCGIFAIGTAVHPEYRLMGVATALKAAAILRAQQEGMQEAITCTANPAMLAVNQKLGYHHVATEIRLVKHL